MTTAHPVPPPPGCLPACGGAAIAAPDISEPESLQRRSDLLDPRSWTKSPRPVFTTNEQTRQYGPGHSSFTVAEDGKTDVLVYHARDYRDIAGDPLYDPNRLRPGDRPGGQPRCLVPAGR